MDDEIGGEVVDVRVKSGGNWISKRGARLCCLVIADKVVERLSRRRSRDVRIEESVPENIECHGSRYAE